MAPMSDPLIGSEETPAPSAHPEDAAREAEWPSIPARIFLQVNEGVPNELVTFDLHIRATAAINPDGEPDATGARLTHEADIGDIATALARALREQLEAHITAQTTEAGSAGARKWAREMGDWVGDATDVQRAEPAGPEGGE